MLAGACSTKYFDHLIQIVFLYVNVAIDRVTIGGRTIEINEGRIEL